MRHDEVHVLHDSYSGNVLYILEYNTYGGNMPYILDLGEHDLVPCITCYIRVVYIGI